MLFLFKVCLSRESQFLWDKGRPRKKKNKKKPLVKQKENVMIALSDYPHFIQTK